MSRAGAPVGGLLAMAGGVALAAAASGTWLERDATRDVGGVPVGSSTLLPGSAFAPLALPLGILLVLLGVGALLAHGVARRVLGAGAIAAATAGAALTALGAVEAIRAEGSVTSAPWIAVAGALAAVVGGLLAVTAPRAAPLLDERYTVEGAGEATDEDEDEEWRLAAGEAGPDDPDAPLR